MTSTRPRLAGTATLAALALVAALLAYLPTATAQPELDTSGPLAFTGSVTDLRTLDDVTVVVSIEPPSDRLATLRTGVGVSLHRLPPSAVRTAGNRFAVVLDPATVPDAHVSRDGKVNFEVDVYDPVTSQRAATSTTVRRVTYDRAQVWADALQVVSAQAGKGSAGTVKAPRLTTADLGRKDGATTLAQVTAELASRLPALTTTMQPAGPAAPAGARTADPDSAAATAAAAGAICAFAPNVPTRRRWATVGTSYPVGKHTSKLLYSSRTESEFGVGCLVRRGCVLDRRWQQDPRRRLGPELPLLQHDPVLPDPGRVPAQHLLQLPGLRDQPEVEAGPAARLHQVPPALQPPELEDVRACQDSGRWYRGRVRGNDYRLSFGVKFKKVLGIDLSTRRAYSEDASLWYYSPVKRRLCGNDDEAGYASKIRERFKK